MRIAQSTHNKTVTTDHKDSTFNSINKYQPKYVKKNEKDILNKQDIQNDSHDQKTAYMNNIQTDAKPSPDRKAIGCGGPITMEESNKHLSDEIEISKMQARQNDSYDQKMAYMNNIQTDASPLQDTTASGCGGPMELSDDMYDCL